jgi:predicted DNA-binding transcriptional regulator YafY
MFRMSEIDRLYSYRALLARRRAVPRQELLDRLEISPATFKRDLAKLRDRLNVPIIFDRDFGGYRLEGEGPREELPGLWFSQEEILALLTIQTMIAQLEPGVLGPKLKPLQKRLDDMLASQGLSAQTLAQRVRLVHAGKRRLGLRSFEAIANATLERKQLRITHLNRQTGKSLSRTISPQQLVHYRDNWYVDAWCHLRLGLRSFAIDAITECEVLTQEAKDFDPEIVREAMKNGYGIFGGQVHAWAKLTFSVQRARWVQHEEWHPDQVGTMNEDGTFTLEVPYSDERELVGDILRHGADVRVESPASLVQRVREQLARAGEQYTRGLAAR